MADYSDIKHIVKQMSYEVTSLTWARSVLSTIQSANNIVYKDQTENFNNPQTSQKLHCKLYLRALLNKRQLDSF